MSCSSNPLIPKEIKEIKDKLSTIFDPTPLYFEVFFQGDHNPEQDIIKAEEPDYDKVLELQFKYSKILKEKLAAIGCKSITPRYLVDETTETKISTGFNSTNCERSITKHGEEVCPKHESMVSIDSVSSINSYLIVPNFVCMKN